MRLNPRVLLTILASSFVTLPVLGSVHHSMSEFDRSTVTEVEGEVVSIFWRNPHILLDIATMDATGY